MTTYRVLSPVVVRAQASAFATEVCRLKARSTFVGQPHGGDPAWIVRTLGGYVARRQVWVVPLEGGLA